MLFYFQMDCGSLPLFHGHGHHFATPVLPLPQACVGVPPSLASLLEPQQMVPTAPSREAKACAGFEENLVLAVKDCFLEWELREMLIVEGGAGVQYHSRGCGGQVPEAGGSAPPVTTGSLALQLPRSQRKRHGLLTPHLAMSQTRRQKGSLCVK